MLSPVQQDTLRDQVVLGVARILPTSRPFVPADSVIWRDQDTPFPPEPFATIMTLGSQGENGEAEQIQGDATLIRLDLPDPPPDGLYQVVIEGRGYEVTAASWTSTQVLEGLADEILEAGERLQARMLAADSLAIAGLMPGLAWTCTVASPGDALLASIPAPVLIEMIREIHRVRVEFQIGTRREELAPSHLQGPADLMRRLQAHLRSTFVDEALQARGLALDSIGQIREPTVSLRGSQTGLRAVMDATFRVAALEATTPDWIETFEGEVRVAHDSGSPLTIPFESAPE